MSLVIVFLTLIIGGTLVINVVIPEILHNLYTFIEKAPEQIKNIEKSISELEETLEELQNQLCLESVYSNPEESNRVNKEIRSAESKLESLYEEWEKLAE